MKRVTMYTKTGCPYCEAAKKHYADEGIAVTEINISERPDEAAKLLRITGGQRIVPVILEDGAVKLGFGGG